jgi:hypothetical protein
VTEKETGSGEPYSGFAETINLFHAAKAKADKAARYRMTLRLVFGTDLEEVEAASPERLDRLERRMVRRLERERLNGARGHWSYDLNRHIAIKLTLDFVRERMGLQGRDGVSPSGGGPGPSPWRAATGRRRSLAQPSGSRGPGPTSRDRPRA